MKRFSSIVITGASSGIGEALAVDYAAPGVALALTGRDAQRLEAVAVACRSKGATVVAAPIDVVDRDVLSSWLTAFDDSHPVDLILANAGISIDKDNSSLDDFSIIRKTLDVNIGGVLNTVEPLLPRLVARKSGQIAIVSSLASFIGLPYSASYNASKAAVMGLTLPVARDLAQHGVRVVALAPGLFETGMSAGMPTKVAQNIIEKVILFPNRMGQAPEFSALVRHVVENAYLNATTLSIDGGARL